MEAELYQVDVYNPAHEEGRDEYLFYFQFAPQRWSREQGKWVAWWIASKLFEADESVAPGSTKGMLLYINPVFQDPKNLPGPAYPVSEGIRVWVARSPVFSQLQNEIITHFRLQWMAGEIQARLRAIAYPTPIILHRT